MRATLEHAVHADAIVAAGLAIVRRPFVRRAPAHSADRRGPAADDADTRVRVAVRCRRGDCPRWRERAVSSARARIDVARVSRRDQRRAARRHATSRRRRARMSTRYPVVCGISPALVPRPRDWPERFVIAGHWWLPHDPAWTPAPALAAFLDAGEAPRLHRIRQHGRLRSRAGASAGARRARRTPRAAVLGLERRSAPAICLSTVLQIGRDAARIGCCRARACVVHHGGAGTTHAVARAGVPVDRRTVRGRPAVLGRPIRRASASRRRRFRRRR